MKEKMGPRTSGREPKETPRIQVKNRSDGKAGRGTEVKSNFSKRK